METPVPNTGGMGAYCDGRILTDPQAGDHGYGHTARYRFAMARRGRRLRVPIRRTDMTAEGPKCSSSMPVSATPKRKHSCIVWRGDFAAVLHATAHGELKNTSSPGGAILGVRSARWARGISRNCAQW